MVTAILVAGLVFYQDKKNTTSGLNPSNQSVVSTTNNKTTTTKNNPNTEIPTTSTPTSTTTSSTNTSSSSNITLSMAEIAKHNSKNDCWLLISGKVYNITDYFGSHPGGNSTMTLTCGKDATAAYATQNPNATGDSSRSAHSEKARSLLNNYYVGDFNQTINL